jgi:UDP-hydrolysing UDP-N-acetyl-D-glucosamine 2-epimerase
MAVSSYLRKIPIVHYEGGDVTEGGALDDNIRHAITKISNIHLTSNKKSLIRIIKMGEEKWRCLNVGYSPLYFIKKQKFNLDQIIQKYSLDQSKALILFTLHPIIKNKNIQKKEVDEIFKSLMYLIKKNQLIISYPNFDPGYKYIIKKINEIKKINKHVKVFRNLGRKNYHSLLYYIGKTKKGFCMGNSSSGIKETVIFRCPTLNIGDRQKSRLKSNNVMDVDADKKKILKLSNIKLKKYKKYKNPYELKKIFEFLPDIIERKLSRKDLINKRCTI